MLAVGTARFLVAKLGGEAGCFGFVGGARIIYIRPLHYGGTGQTRTILSRDAKMASDISKEMMQLLGWRLYRLTVAKL